MAYSYDQGNVVNLKHLKKAVARTQNEVTSLAELVVGAFEDLVLQASISVPTSAWSANSDAATLAEGYNYKADVTITGILATANANISFTAASLTAAYNAGVCSTFLVSNGSITLYSVAVPESTLTGTLNATQLAED